MKLKLYSTYTHTCSYMMNYTLESTDVTVNWYPVYNLANKHSWSIIITLTFLPNHFPLNRLLFLNLANLGNMPHWKFWKLDPWASSVTYILMTAIRISLSAAWLYFTCSIEILMWNCLYIGTIIMFTTIYHHMRKISNIRLFYRRHAQNLSTFWELKFHSLPYSILSWPWPILQGQI